MGEAVAEPDMRCYRMLKIYFFNSRDRNFYSSKEKFTAFSQCNSRVFNIGIS